MFPPLFKEIFKKFYGSGALGKTEAAVGTANQVAMATQRTGRGTGRPVQVKSMTAQGTGMFFFSIHKNKL
jgi:hypothetical protein